MTTANTIAKTTTNGHPHAQMRVRWLLALFLPLTAVADDQLIGVGSQVWANQLSASTTTACFVTTRGGSVCALFPANTNRNWRSNIVTVVGASAASRCCWSGATGLEMTGFELSDASGPNGTGICAGFGINPVGGYGRHDARPSFSDVGAAAGGRAGLCSIAETGTRIGLYAPCTPGAGGDSVCSARSAGTCVAEASWTQVQRDAASVFLLCEADTISTIEAVIETVRR